MTIIADAMVIALSKTSLGLTLAFGKKVPRSYLIPSREGI
jgi:hypothetical protein